MLADEAGVELLEPDGRGIRLTDAGHALVLRADDIIAAVDRAAEEMLAYRSGNATVRLGMFPSGSTLLLPELLYRAADAGSMCGPVISTWLRRRPARAYRLRHRRHSSGRTHRGHLLAPGPQSPS